MTIAATRKQTVRYRYDALGRRVQRYFAGTKENTKFIYYGLDVVADDNFGVLTKYQNGRGIDNKLKLTSNGVSKYFLQDHLGSTVGLTDVSGNVSSSASYDSYGNSSNNLTTRYQYTGREFDSFTGLQYYRARWYDSQIGRFISEDPIGFRGGDVNLYGYVSNKSIKFNDPTGLRSSGNGLFLIDFILGTGDQARTYQPGSTELEEMRRSPGADALRKDFYSHGCQNRTFGYSTWQAAKDTLFHPSYWGDTSFQVGGFVGNAIPREDNTVDYRIGNIAGAHSFFLHIPPDAPDNGPFRSIYQDFHWNEPIERCKCHEEVSYNLKNASGYNRLVGISLYPTQ